MSACFSPTRATVRGPDETQVKGQPPSKAAAATLLNNPSKQLLGEGFSRRWHDAWRKSGRSGRFSTASSESFRSIPVQVTRVIEHFKLQSLSLEMGTCESGTGFSSLIWSAASHRGRRLVQQDAFVAGVPCGLGSSCAFFAIYDGHGQLAGHHASQTAAAQLHHMLEQRLANQKESSVANHITSTFVAFDEFLHLQESHVIPKQGIFNRMLGNYESEGYSRSGTCALVVLILPQKVFIANIGDSQAISKGGTLTRIHRVNNEAEASRISWAGGYISDGRVNGLLVPTRAFGDFCFKPETTNEKHIVTCLPEITQIDRESLGDWLVLASDGVVDFLPAEQIIELCESNANLASDDLATLILDKALVLGSQDNVTCIVIRLGHPSPSLGPASTVDGRPIDGDLMPADPSRVLSVS